jgi:hypothetical protein
MSDTLPNVKLPAKTPVELYAATGITAGVQICVQNNSTSDVRVYSGTDEPTMGVDGSILLRPGITGKNETGDTGLWAWCVNATSVNVKEA